MTGPEVYTDFAGLAELRATARGEAPSSLREVARQFEALFLQMVLKSLREASPAPEAESDALGHYREMYDSQLALHLTRGPGLGLAEILARQLGGSKEPAPRTTAPAATGARGVPETAGSPEAFTRALWPHAEATAARLGVAPQALIAQAALESGWGRAVIRHPDGRSSHNVFGIKADPDWPGERVTAATLEYEDGVAVRRRETFRAYASYAEAFDDYARLLAASPRYREALAAGDDPRAFAQALARAGYATDPAYGRKFESVLQSTALRAGLAALKIPPGRTLT